MSRSEVRTPPPVPRRRPSPREAGWQRLLSRRAPRTEGCARCCSLLAEYNANGKETPGESPVPNGETHQSDRPLLVDIVADYRHNVLPDYEHDAGRHNRLDNLAS